MGFDSPSRGRGGARGGFRGNGRGRGGDVSFRGRANGFSPRGRGRDFSRDNRGGFGVKDGNKFRGGFGRRDGGRGFKRGSNSRGEFSPRGGGRGHGGWRGGSGDSRGFSEGRNRFGDDGEKKMKRKTTNFDEDSEEGETQFKPVSKKPKQWKSSSAPETPVMKAFEKKQNMLPKKTNKHKGEKLPHDDENEETDGESGEESAEKSIGHVRKTKASTNGSSKNQPSEEVESEEDEDEEEEDEDIDFEDEEDEAVVKTGKLKDLSGIPSKKNVEEIEEGEDEEEDEEEEDEEMDEEESVPSPSKPDTKKVPQSKVHVTKKSGTKDENEEDEDSDEGSMKDENEESDSSSHEVVQHKAIAGKTKGKGCLKTPMSSTAAPKKKVDISAPVTPSTKHKTPLTPYPVKKASSTPVTVGTQKPQLKFEESDEEDNDEDDDDDEDDDEEMSEDEDEEEGESDMEEEKLQAQTAKVTKTGKKGSSTAVSNEIPEVTTGTLKRIRDEEPQGVSKIAKVFGETDILSEEERRKEDRDSKSLFIRGFPKTVKMSQLSELHPDIVSVRHNPNRSFAWLIFANPEACVRAFEVIQKKAICGKEIEVDFCGSKSKKRPINQQKPPTSLPINPLELFITGFPNDTTKDQMKLIFRNATEIHFPTLAKAKNKRFCFVKFATEADAKAAFVKGRSLKIGNALVDVLYARIKKDTEEVKSERLATKKKEKADLSASREGSKVKAETSVKANVSKTKVQKEDGSEDNEEESDGEAIGSSDEGIEEVSESRRSLGKVEHQKQALQAKSLGVKEKKETPAQKSGNVGKNKTQRVQEEEESDEEDENEEFDEDEEEDEESN